MTIELRPYQLNAVERIRAAIRTGARNILVVAPTGSGKTILAADIIERATTKGKRSAFVVDRISLIDQTSALFQRYGIEHGVIQADHPDFHPSRLVQVCSLQTLCRRRWPSTDLVVIDEAHSVTEAVRERLGPRNMVCIGLTATPFTTGLGKLYDAVINVATTNELIADGFLSRYRIFSCVEPDMASVRIVRGEFDENETEVRALRVVGDVVAEYLKHGMNLKFICSAVNTKHVMELKRQFLAAGINVATYTYRDRDQDRTEVVAEFRKPDSLIRGLITVTAASKGFDVPDIGCVIMARPLRKSLTEHIQFFGRGLRIAPGKGPCVILDHSGNCARFWAAWNHFFEVGCVELDDGKKKSSRKVQVPAEAVALKCVACSVLHAPAPFCPDCGHEYEVRQTIEHAPGTLKELLASGDEATMYRELWPQIVGHVQPTCKMHGFAVGQRKAQAMYRSMTGRFAPGHVETTVPTEPTLAVANKIKSDKIRYALGRRALKEAA